jgi:ribokinase
LKTDIFVVGSLNADLTVYLDRRPAPGETVLGGDLRISPGGKGANQAVASARYGGSVAMLGRVGNDQHGQLLRATLAAAGVGADHIHTTPGRPTGTAMITVTPDGENAIVVAPGANAAVTAADIANASADIRAAAILLCQLELPVKVVTAAAQAAAGHARVLLNAAPPLPLPSELLALCDPLVVNRQEAAALLGEQQLTTTRMRTAIHELLRLGPQSVVVTLGGDGAFCADHAGTMHVPAPQVRVVDTTGAGDVFVGALATALAAGQPLRAATQAGVHAGTHAVQVTGAQVPFTPNWAEAGRES